MSRDTLAGGCAAWRVPQRRRARRGGAGDYDRGVPASEPHPAPEPDRAPPLRPAKVNAKALFGVGTIAWMAALLGIGVAFLAGRAPDSRLAWVCLAGILLGAIGYLWAHKVHLIDDKGMSE